MKPSCPHERVSVNSLRGSAAQCTARRLCRSQHLYRGRAVCFCITRQSHVTSRRGGFLVNGAVVLRLLGGRLQPRRGLAMTPSF